MRARVIRELLVCAWMLWKIVLNRRFGTGVVGNELKIKAKKKYHLDI